MIRLYELKKGAKIKVSDDFIPPRDVMIEFDHVDGCFSYCIDEQGRVCHLSASTPLKKVNGHYEIIEEESE